MYQQNELKQPVHIGLLTKRALIGAGIACALIAIFLSGVNNPKPEWSPYWMVRPMVIVPLAGATGGAVYYFLVDYLRYRSGAKKALAIVGSILIYIVGLWMGSVLGLAGTLWN